MCNNRNGELTFLLYPCEDNPKRIVAHCLELDVVAVEDNEAKAILLLKELVQELFEAAIEDDTVDRIFRPAPPRYWQMRFESQSYKPTQRVAKRHISVEPVKRVVYALAQ